MQRTSVGFTFTLPLWPVVHRNFYTCHVHYVRGELRKRVSHIGHNYGRHALACASRTPTGTSDDVRIRQATQSDIPTASRVLASAFTQDFLTQESVPTGLVPTLVPLFEFLTRLEISSQLHQRVKLEKHAILLAEMNHEAVGCAEVGVLDISRLTKGGDEVKEWRRGGGEAYVGNVGVLAGYRGRGVGRRLVRSAESTAVEWGLGNVWLCVEARNNNGIRFYERLGFGCVAQEPDWFDEIGKRRRLFLCSSKGASVGQWANAKVVGGKLGVIQYLRYCLYDLRRRREAAEKN